MEAGVVVGLRLGVMSVRVRVGLGVGVGVVMVVGLLQLLARCMRAVCLAVRCVASILACSSGGCGTGRGLLFHEP